MIKKITTLVKENQNVFVHHAVILGSTLVGAIIAGSIGRKDQVVVEEVIVGEYTEDSDLPEQETASED